MNNNSLYFGKVTFEGRVQGVGFRLKVYNIAKGYEVVGFVRNENDGSVLVEITGEKKELIEFVQEIKRIMAVFIKDTQESYSYIEKIRFNSFDIR